MTEIVQLTSADESVCNEIHAVLRQLNSEKHCSLPYLQTMLQNPMTELWVAKEDGKIVGIATLTLAMRLSGVSARLEDVVVDESMRGKGIGKTLCKKIIERAKELGAYSLHLTSRPEREVANKMYQGLGFEPKKTNVYRLKL